jgi:oligopeptide transport system substrate-binding protein
VAQYGEAPAPGLTGEPGKQVLLGPEMSTYNVWINNTDQYLKNADLRKAISLAINREAIAQTVYEGTREPATGPVPKSIVGYQPDAWPYTKYDVAQAKTLLAQAGYPDGKGLPTLKLSFNSGAGHEPVMALIQSDLQKIGIQTKLDPHQWAEYTSDFTKVSGGKYAKPQGQQLIRLGWQADYPIMDNFINPLFNSASENNVALYKDTAVDQAIVDARKTTDPAARIKKYQAIEKQIGLVMPMMPIVNYRHKNVVSDRTMDLTYSPTQLPSYTTVWLSK